MSLEVEETFVKSERVASRHRQKERIKRLSILVKNSFDDRLRFRNIIISALNLGNSVIILFKFKNMFPEVTTWVRKLLPTDVSQRNLFVVQ
jgi:hypothetical protein